MYGAKAELLKPTKRLLMICLLSENIQFALPQLNTLLSIILQSFFKHRFLSDGFMMIIIVPISER